MTGLTTIGLDRWPAQPNGTTVAEEDKLYPTGGFKSLGHVYWCAARRGRRGQTGNRDAVVAVKQWEDVLRVKSPSGMFEESDPDGGLLVPPQYGEELYNRTKEQNQLLKYLSPIPLRNRVFRLPALKEDSRADGSRNGGLAAHWQSEAGQYTSVSPKFRMIGSELHKLTALVYVTDELIEDSPRALESYVSPIAANEINFKLNDAVINGTGNGMPQGMLVSPSKIAVSAVSAQGTNTIVLQNILDMYARIHIWQRQSMLWLYNQNTERQLLKLYNSSGSSGGPILLWPDGKGGWLLNGHPALVVEQCPDLGTEGDLIAFAPDGYLAVVKQLEMETSMSIHLSFDYDQSVLKFLFRMDGQVKDLNSIAPYKGSNATSAVVTLSSTRT